MGIEIPIVNSEFHFFFFGGGWKITTRLGRSFIFWPAFPVFQEEAESGTGKAGYPGVN